MKSQILTTAALLITMNLSALPALALPQTDTATLNAQLKQSVCTQNWGEAVKIIDKMIAITSSSNQTQHDELKIQRGRMHNLSVSKTNVDSWLENYCATPGSTPAAARRTAISSSTAALVPNNAVLGQSYEAVESYLGSPRHKTKKTYHYSVVGLWKSFPEAPSTFVVNFTSGQAKSITLHLDKDVSYGRKQASEFFDYIFDYQPLLNGDCFLSLLWVLSLTTATHTVWMLK